MIAGLGDCAGKESGELGWVGGGGKEHELWVGTELQLVCPPVCAMRPMQTAACRNVR